MGNQASTQLIQNLYSPYHFPPKPQQQQRTGVQNQSNLPQQSNSVASNNEKSRGNNSKEGGWTAQVESQQDGFKWRKYGQKQVKGCKFPRNYFKCTQPDCSVKKYVEKSDDGKEMVSYKGGEHSHTPNKVVHINATDQLAFKNGVLSENMGEQKLQQEQTQNNNIGTALPVKGEPGTIEPLETRKESFVSIPRLVVETCSSNVDHMDDGYSWRKYGQKPVKGGLYPRGYFRCTEESCPVKKQVEQNGSSFVTRYEGSHNHLAPLLVGLDTQQKRRKLGNVAPFNYEEMK